MKAIILAAGRGSRLSALTKDKPKCLTAIWGRPLIDWQTDALRNAGISEIAVVRGYLSEKLNLPGLTYFENNNWENSNMVNTMLCAREWLETDDCVISYSDIVYPKGTVSRLIKCRSDIVIPYNTDWRSLWKLRFEDPLTDAETFKIDKNGVLIEIGTKAGNLDEIHGQYMGLLKFTPVGWKVAFDYLDSLPREECAKLDCTALLNRLLARGVVINTIPVPGSWFEIDNENDIKVYESNWSVPFTENESSIKKPA
ncbi:MAG: phosphocholine cytidylyltransferase family protein [Elusimicrobiota bacterium]